MGRTFWHPLQAVRPRTSQVQPRFNNHPGIQRCMYISMASTVTHVRRGQKRALISLCNLRGEGLQMFPQSMSTAIEKPRHNVPVQFDKRVSSAFGHDAMTRPVFCWHACATGVVEGSSHYAPAVDSDLPRASKPRSGARRRCVSSHLAGILTRKLFHMKLPCENAVDKCPVLKLKQCTAI